MQTVTAGFSRRYFALTCAYVAGVGSILGGTLWNQGDVIKERVFLQTSAAGSVQDADADYRFRASARNSFSGQTASLAIPAGSSAASASLTSLVGAHWVFSQTYPDRESLDTAFRGGTYTWTINRTSGTPSTLTQALVLPEAPGFPETTPTIIGGTWIDGRLAVDAVRPSFAWQPWTGAPADGRIEIELWHAGGAGGSSSGAGTASFTLGSAQPVGRTFDAWLSFRSYADQRNLSDPTGPNGDTLVFRAGTANTLYFRMVTVESPPVISAQPASVTIASGRPAYLRVLASGTGAIAYQWFQGATGDVSRPIPGGTQAALTTAPLLETTSFWVRVTNTLSTASATATVSVSSSAVPVTATHVAAFGGFRAGGAVTVNATVSCTSSPSRIDYAVLLPAGWVLVDPGAPTASTRPSLGTTSLAEWSWMSAPVGSVSFSYTVWVPFGSTVDESISALATATLNGTQHQALATADPLLLRHLPLLHSADIDGNNRLSLLELTRVIELYNYRSGTSRTGQYKPLAGTEDGFAAGPP